MNMQLRIAHTTRYEYSGKAVASYNQARLTPVTTLDQIVVHSRIEISPKPWTFEYRDYFGTQVTAFEVVDPHDAMSVAATSTVQINRRPAPQPTLSWADLDSREVADRWTEYLVLPDAVAPTSDFAQRTKQIAADYALPGEAARDLCALVHDEVEFVPGATDVRGVAATAWQQRGGVCQDMVHLTIGGLRSIGIPARYVSGYFHPDPDPALGITVPGQSHAWVEWWDDGWHAFDPCNNEEPGDRYVSVAHGRDYHDVRPLSGIFTGTGTSRMNVEVEITRLA
ncbi:transglutaminase family protein [Nocardioides sp. R-C-SC26]|uniref:transglutaminase family protein n=1 Tax=Nocardioides sp. R-C-SC26 TaxID=2870414 RepID=UPI001E5695DC|nr:transglutaminase family protein [Nocardioides sp. R-C-SC26]